MKSANAAKIAEATRKLTARTKLAKTKDPEAHLGTPLIAERFNRDRRTIDRWKNNPRLGFPPPDLVILKRAYWRLATIEEWEQRQAANMIAAE